VLDHLANHANTGPFLGRQLIQRLVTSNPSLAYVARIAAVWANDGTGARGNLGAVVRAILLDDEAMHGAENAPATFGKLKEPLLRQAQIWRAFGGHPKVDQFGLYNPEQPFGEAMLRADTVFNFFRPDHEPLGELAALDLQAPEFQILNHSTITRTANQFNRCVVRWQVGNAGNAEDYSILCDFRNELAVAADANALLARLDRILLAGSMPASLQQILLAHLAQVSDPLQRVQDAIWLIVTSPQYAVQK